MDPYSLELLDPNSVVKIGIAFWFWNALFSIFVFPQEKNTNLIKIVRNNTIIKDDFNNFCKYGILSFRIRIRIQNREMTDPYIINTDPQRALDSLWRIMDSEQ